MRATELKRGGRSARVVAGVLEAAVAELVRAGFAQFRVENVAEQAGVNKTSIYRRWRTRGQVVSAALRSLSLELELPPETGVLRDDLLSLLRVLTAHKRTPRLKVLARLVVEESEDPEVTRAVQALRKRHRTRWAAIITRAIERGELVTQSDPAFLMELISSAVFSRLSHSPDTVDRAFMERVVDFVLAGARAQRFSRPFKRSATELGRPTLR